MFDLEKNFKALVVVLIILGAVAIGAGFVAGRSRKIREPVEKAPTPAAPATPSGA